MQPTTQRAAIQNVLLWCARLTWAVLPITTGNAFTDALQQWSTAPKIVAGILLWAVWAAGLVALLAPRPWGLTLLRVAAPAATLTTIVTVWSTSNASASLAIGWLLLATVLALAPPVALAAGNALAYGDELRFPLRIPTPLQVLPVPLAVLLIASGAVTGPLLIADERFVVGIPALIVGWPLAAFLIRSLHALSRRWLVLVPAGVVVVDPLILTDPALMRREQIVSLGRTVDDPSLARSLDLRLGARHGSVTITLHEPYEFARRLGRTGTALAETDVVLVAPIQVAQMLEVASTRRLAVRG